jgi:hypothetical protein
MAKITDSKRIEYLKIHKLTDREELVVNYILSTISNNTPVPPKIYKEFQAIYKKYKGKK